MMLFASLATLVTFVAGVVMFFGWWGLLVVYLAGATIGCAKVYYDYHIKKPVVRSKFSESTHYYSAMAWPLLWSVIVTGASTQFIARLFGWAPGRR